MTCYVWLCLIKFTWNSYYNECVQFSLVALFAVHNFWQELSNKMEPKIYNEMSTEV